MPWLADTDVDAAHGIARSLVEAWTEAELRGRALRALSELVPADVLTWEPGRARHGRRPPRGGPGRGRAARRVCGTRGRRGGSPAAGRACRPPASGAAPLRGRRAPPPVPQRAVRRPAAPVRRRVRDRDRHAHQSRRGRGRRARAHRARVLRARPRRARHRAPRPRGHVAGRGGARAPRPRSRGRAAPGHRRRAARRLRRDRALERRRRTLARRAFRGGRASGLAAGAGRRGGSRCRRARRSSASATAGA